MNRNEEIDGLTGLSNMYAFRKNAQEIIDDEDIKERGLAIIYFDVENFKIYNAKYGFEAGDRFLQNLSKNLSKIFNDLLVARFSDDHFVVLTYRNAIEARIEDLHRRVINYNPEAETGLRAGIYYVEVNDNDISIACDKARMACNSIKKNYESIYRFYDKEIGDEINLRQYIIHHIGDAVLKEYIQVYYQPVVRVISGRVCGFEALARWIDPDLGFISHADFVPVLEKYHIIRKLDLAVTQYVCNVQKKVMESGGQIMPVSINLSQQDFMDDDIVSEIDEIVLESGIPPEYINIEITESIFSIDSDRVTNIIDAFRLQGYEVWMDDFGSGYSSLNSMQKYTFDCLKLDMKFLAGFSHSRNSKIIIESVIGMTKQLGIRTIAEGVESEEEAEYLRQVGCDQIQGFLYSKPGPFDEVYNLDIPKENTGLRKYHEKIGTINLLSQDPLGKEDDATKKIKFPMALVEEHKGHLDILTYNESFTEYVSLLGFASVNEANDMLNSDSENSVSVRNYMKSALDNDRFEVCHYSRNGLRCTLQINFIANYRSRNAFLFLGLVAESE
jgi:diguanylate cyclase (GGDEF)-like protein